MLLFPILSFATNNSLEDLIKQKKQQWLIETQKYKEILNPTIENLKKEANEVKKFFYYENNKLKFNYEAYLHYLEDKHNKRILKNNKEKIYIAMSSSVPVDIWKRYICFVENNHLKAIFVLRGFIGGIKSGIKPTLSFIKKLIEGWSCPGSLKTVHNVEIDIDPWIFRKSHLNQVPAVIFNNKVSLGDYSLKWHLEKLGINTNLK